MSCENYTTESLLHSLAINKKNLEKGIDVEYSRKSVHEIEHELGNRMVEY
jgi:hypothetical protein